LKRPIFEELDFQPTPLGDLVLRRRSLPDLDHRVVHEIILGDAYLMTSLFTVVESELSRLGIAATEKAFPGQALNVVVGGLGLGYTAKVALDHPSVASLRVVDYLAPVIEWHQRGLVPLGRELSESPRCRFVHGDFFKLAASDSPSFEPESCVEKHHAVLLDIDHSPANLLHERHQGFYSPEGLQQLADKLHPGGIFALWSDDPPETSFMEALAAVFDTCESHIVPFENPHLGGRSESTVYVARSKSN
jgi:spermidine synthase